MTWKTALRAPLEENLAPFLHILKQQVIAHRVTEEAGEQVLWVAGSAEAEQVRELYQQLQSGQLSLISPITPGVQRRKTFQQSGFVQQLRASPVTTAVLMACLLVALITQLGDNFDSVRWFTFSDFKIQGDSIYFMTLAHSLEQGQWWRLWSPMLLHFGFLHLAMNMMWYWELGRRIEYQQGGLFLLALTLLAALVSNSSQFVVSGAALFGGLSGVLYGVLGHCWIYQRIHPQASYALPKGVVAMMLIWLLLCLFGVITALGFGQIANAAHVSGLLLGCLTGGVSALIARHRAA